MKNMLKNPGVKHTQLPLPAFLIRDSQLLATRCSSKPKAERFVTRFHPVKIFSLIVTCAVLLAFSSVCRAQLVADGTTAYINGTSANITGDLVVGTNGSFTTLVIMNAGAVTNTGNGIIGQNSTAMTNRVIVTDANSAWSVGGNLNFGVYGSHSELIITNGGKVEDNNGNMAFNGGSGDLAVVTGANSVWTNHSSVNIGNSGAFNLVTVTNGGTLACGNLTVGNTGASNKLMVVAGGNALSGSGRIGNGYFSVGNVAVISDPGSQWRLSSELDVGLNSPFNQVQVSNGANVFSGGLFLGTQYIGGGSSSSNLVLIAGTGSTWTNTSTTGVGFSGTFNQLIITNGGAMESLGGNGSLTLGQQTTGSNNVLIVDGANSRFSNQGSSIAQMNIGFIGSDNRMQVSGGGAVATGTGFLGYGSASSNNVALVTDSGSQWVNSANLYVGYDGSFNELTINNSGTVTTPNLVIGFDPASSGNVVTINGGSLMVTNGGSGVVDVRGGTLILNAGTILVDELLLTNGSAGTLEFNGGLLPPLSVATLSVSNSVVDNGSPLVVGNGSPAAYRLLGNGLHRFNDGLVIHDGASLWGGGTIVGPLTVSASGLIDFSTSGGGIQRLTLSNSPSLSGGINMRVRVAGGRTNDFISTPGPLTYGGTLSVSRLSATSPTNGDVFKMFSAASYTGAFSSISLPTLNSGLMWINRLLVDGSIAVVPLMPPDISGMMQAGTNFVFDVTGGSPDGAYDLLTSTNMALPLASWTTNRSGNFDWLGNASFSITMNPALHEQFFRIQTH